MGDHGHLDHIEEEGDRAPKDPGNCADDERSESAGSAHAHIDEVHERLTEDINSLESLMLEKFDKRDKRLDKLKDDIEEGMQGKFERQGRELRELQGKLDQLLPSMLAQQSMLQKLSESGTASSGKPFQRQP